jgi:limonene-1,2-epoxide hydrolase
VNTLELDTQLNALIVQGKNTEAFLKYYDENVVAQENDEAERHGREQWIKAREAMAKTITKYEAKVLANAANGNVSFSEWSYDVVITGTGPMKMNQVAVRRWKNGRVVRERFYHK